MMSNELSSGNINSGVGSNFLEMLHNYGAHIAKHHINTYMDSFQIVTDNISKFYIGCFNTRNEIFWQILN